MKRLEYLRSQTNCRTMAELLRKIVSKEKITLIHRDMTLQVHIQSWLAFGWNFAQLGIINQLTRFFHAADDRSLKNVLCF